MSVGDEAVLLDHGKAPEAILDGHPGYGLVSITRAVLDELNLRLESVAITDEPWHALVWGTKPRQVRQELARRCHPIIRPDPPTGSA